MNGDTAINTSCGLDPDGMPYDLDLRNSGSGWTGTFAGIIRQTVADITDDGPWSPAEVTLSDGTGTGPNTRCTTRGSVFRFHITTRGC